MISKKILLLPFLGTIAVASLFISQYGYNSKRTPKQALGKKTFCSTNRQKTPALNSSDLCKLQELFDLGNEEYNKNNMRNAIRNYRKALLQNPIIVQALTNLGKSFAKEHNHDMAINEYKAALSINPHHLETYLLLSRSLRAQKKHSKALAVLQKALKIRPQLGQAYVEQAKVYLDQERYPDALLAIKKAEKIMPTNIHVHLMRGHILNWKGDINQAINSYKKASLLDPTCSNAHYNLGHTLKVYCKFSEAIASLTKAAELDPEHVDTHVALSHAYWALGDFDHAWKEYEWRWKQFKKDPRNKTIPEWHGQDINGKTIMLYCEQGLGDTLQFIRFAQTAKERGAIVWCKVQKPLKKLLSLCPYIDHLVNETSDLKNVDYQAALMSMPGRLKLTPATIPAPQQYLYANDNLISTWGKKLSNNKNFKIGICWNVAQQHEVHKLPIQQRSFPLNKLIPLSQNKKVSLYCLQLLDNDSRSKIPNTINMHIFDQNFDKKHGSFMDSAAVITHLDLIITADTSIAHLAAGLGKKVWILLPYSPDCRWQIAKNNSPWYPSMKIFRQTEPKDWNHPIQNIENALNKLLRKTISC